MVNLPRGKLALVLLVAVVIVSAGVALAATNTAVVSEHTTTSDFESGTLTNMTALDGTLQLSGGGQYSENGHLRYEYEQDMTDSFNNNDGTSETSAGYRTDSVQGSYAKAFDGVDDYAYGPDLDGSRTYATWVYADSTTSNQINIIGSWGSDVVSDLTVWYDGQELTFRHYTGSTETTIFSGQDLPTGTWTHVAVTYDHQNGVIEGFIDGSSVGTKSVSNIDDSGGSFFLGGTSSGGGSFVLDGALDDSRVFTTALTETEMQQVYSLDGTPNTPAYYTSQFHTVEDATQARLNITALANATADVTVSDSNNNVLGTGTYTTSGEKTIPLSGQTTTDIQTTVSVTSSGGAPAFTLASEGVAFENTAPIVDNTTLSPTGTLESDMPTFTVDVSDPDFGTVQGDELNATLYVDGEMAGYDTLTSDGTASVTASVAGESTYYWEVSDDYGGVTQSDSVTITTPAELYVFEEPAPHTLIDGVSVNATITGTGETVALATVTTGTVELGGLPTGEDYVFTLNAEGYYPREVYVDDLYELQSVYLLPESTPSVQNQITLTDRTGRYDEGTIIQVDRVVNTSQIPQLPDTGTEWTTMGGDRLGSSGFYAIDLEEYARYRFTVINDAGESRVLSEYTAKSGGVVDLKIGSIQYPATGDENGYVWDTTHTNVTNGGHTLRVGYNDMATLTDNVTVELYTRDNRTLIDSHDFTNGPYGEAVITFTIDNSTWANKTILVEWSATRDGEVISGSRLVSGTMNMDTPLASMWMNIGFAGGVLILAFLVGAGAGPAPALVTIAAFAGFGVYAGLAPPALGFGSVLLVMLMGAIFIARGSGA